MKIQSDINKLPAHFHQWFLKLWQGTTDWKRQELIDTNETYSLIRMRHQGCWSAGRHVSGYTEWIVALNCKIQNVSYNVPKCVFQKDGRLTKEDKIMIKEKYELQINKS